jgi:hypothetical protein
LADAGCLAARYTIDRNSSGGLLERIRDLNLTLISVNTDGPSTHDSDKEE